MPNPLRFDGEFEFYVANNSHVTISLFDINGRKVMDVYSGMATAGINTRTLNASKLNSGNYTLVMTIGSDSYQNQVKVVK